MKNIAFVSDVKNWAFDITYDGIRKYLESDLYYTSDEPKITKDIVKQYKHVHFFNWLGGQEYAGLPNVSAGVCQHNYEIKWADIAKKYLTKFKKIVAISQILYDKLIKWNSNTYLIQNAVNETLFKPSINEGEFTIGWMAQQTTGGFGERKSREGRKIWDIKGYELILLPLMKRLEDKVKFKILSNNHSNAISREEIAKWYSDIDCFICTSLFEGGPFPVLEAAASAKAIISTRVGIVPELIEPNYNGFIVDAPRNRDDLNPIIAAFETYILILMTNQESCKIMGKRNREIIEKSWTWEKIVPKWKEFFNE